jgi:hypothetical protein
MRSEQRSTKPEKGRRNNGKAEEQKGGDVQLVGKSEKATETPEGTSRKRPAGAKSENDREKSNEPPTNSELFGPAGTR